MKEQQPTAAAAPAPAPDNDKSRNLTGGYNMLAAAFPIINFIMFFLAWFTVPIEVLFRRNFGQRWLTVINFYVGFFVLMFFVSLETLSGAFHSDNNVPIYQQQPGTATTTAPTGPSFYESLMNNSMVIILIIYLLIASYHFFRMWWRDRTSTALHSFDDGTSRFEPVAVYLMQLINIIAIPIIRLYMLLLPKEEQERDIPIPPLINDVTAFTNTVFEPLLLLLLMFIFPGTTRIWLLVSAAALAIYANWKETAKLNKVLDFRDSVIQAQDMSKHRNLAQETTTESLIMRQAADTIKNNPEVAPRVEQRYPDLMDIIEEMNSNPVHIA